MEWSDEALILSARAHGETSVIVELFTRCHGRHAGLVHGGRGRRMRPIVQVGNHVDATWKARLADHLGHLRLDLRAPIAALAIADRARLSALASLAALLRLLPERDAHTALYDVSLVVLDHLGEDDVWPALLVSWEVALLEALGFGLELTTCAASGSRDDLIFVSPRSGRAVSAQAGEALKDRLLPLPAFLRDPAAGAPPEQVHAGLRMTGHFLMTRVLQPLEAQMPEPRQRLLSYLAPDAVGP
ncbi:MAG: DNA repair protein RecO [Pseudomonadota bacterium]